DIADWNSANGAPVKAYECHGGGNQYWTLTGDGELYNPWSRKCLTNPGAGQLPPAGSPVVIWDCSGPSQQRWLLNADGTLRSAVGPVCLEFAGVGNGASLVVNPCSGAPSQRFKVGTPRSAPPASSQCLNQQKQYYVDQLLSDGYLHTGRAQYQ